MCKNPLARGILPHGVLHITELMRVYILRENGLAVCCAIILTLGQAMGDARQGVHDVVVVGLVHWCGGGVSRPCRHSSNTPRAPTAGVSATG